MFHDLNQALINADEDLIWNHSRIQIRKEAWCLNKPVEPLKSDPRELAFASRTTYRDRDANNLLAKHHYRLDFVECCHRRKPMERASPSD